MLNGWVRSGDGCGQRQKAESLWGPGPGLRNPPGRVPVRRAGIRRMEVEPTPGGVPLPPKGPPQSLLLPPPTPLPWVLILLWSLSGPNCAPPKAAGLALQTPPEDMSRWLSITDGGQPQQQQRRPRGARLTTLLSPRCRRSCGGSGGAGTCTAAWTRIPNTSTRQEAATGPPAARRSPC